jgi:hypothetical protein
VSFIAQKYHADLGNMTLNVVMAQLEMGMYQHNSITRRTEEQLCDEQAWSRMDDEGCPNVEPTGFEKDLTPGRTRPALNHL